MNSDFEELQTKYRKAAYEIGYNKAIDDFNKSLKEYLRKYTVHYVSDKDFDYVAKQLKENK